MPSASSYTNKLRALTDARNTKVQYPGNTIESYRPLLAITCNADDQGVWEPIEYTKMCNQCVPPPPAAAQPVVPTADIFMSSIGGASTYTFSTPIKVLRVFIDNRAINNIYALEIKNPNFNGSEVNVQSASYSNTSLTITPPDTPTNITWGIENIYLSNSSIPVIVTFESEITEIHDTEGNYPIVIYP